jgi:hypothetical protein
MAQKIADIFAKPAQVTLKRANRRNFSCSRDEGPKVQKGGLIAAAEGVFRETHRIMADQA